MSLIILCIICPSHHLDEENKYTTAIKLDFKMEKMEIWLNKIVIKYSYPSYDIENIISY